MIEEKLSGGVQSLEVGLSVLNALLEHNKPIILKDLSTKLDMHPAKVHRYLVSLIRMNYAKQLEDGQYALGDQAWRLGLSCIQHTDVLQLVQHLIYNLQSKIGCGIQISKWSPQGPLVVQSIESNHPISIVTKVGSIMPLVNSAAGRVFASYLPEAVVKPLMDAEWTKAALNHYQSNHKHGMIFSYERQNFASWNGDRSRRSTCWDQCRWLTYFQCSTSDGILYCGTRQ
jgi:DNA-binding IclR family transcriptional regulator